jgi:hypothetical protein
MGRIANTFTREAAFYQGAEGEKRSK